jgi:hypothetical protein
MRDHVLPAALGVGFLLTAGTAHPEPFPYASSSAAELYVGDGKERKESEELVRFRNIGGRPFHRVSADQETFRLTVVRSPRIIEGSFNVRLNDQDITDQFGDQTEVTVELPMRAGHNRIRFWAATLVNGSEEHESDEFVVFRDTGSAITAEALPGPVMAD